MPDPATIGTNAGKPKKAVVDGVEVEQFPIADQIAAERFRASTVAMGKKHKGLRLTRLVPPGGTGEQASGDPAT